MRRLRRSYPDSFWKLTLASLFFFGSFNMVIPDLPILLDRLGGNEHYWLIIPSFALIALITRPFSGKFSDSAGRVFVMGLGALATTVACFSYLFIPFVFLFFAVRAFHGLSAGFAPTGYTAYADDVVPPGKRGEAMSIIGISNNVGSATGWVIGSKLTNLIGLEATYTVAGLMGLLSFVLFISLEETLVNKQKFHAGMLRLRKEDLIEKRVLVPAAILLLTAYSSGALLATVADYSNHLGIRNRGMYMSVYIASSLLIRFFSGRWSDVYGRKKTSLTGAAFICFSMLLLVSANGIMLYTVSAVFFGMGFGLIAPSLFAWANDLALPGLKGRAVGTLFVFLEIGIIVGSSVSGLLYDNRPEQFPLVYAISSAVAGLALLFLFRKEKP